MAQNDLQCAWCGSDLQGETEAESRLCPDCSDLFDAEAGYPLSPVEEIKAPHND